MHYYSIFHTIHYIYSQPDKALLSLQDLEKSTLKSFDGINCGAADKLGRLEVKQAVWRAKFAAFGKTFTMFSTANIL